VPSGEVISQSPSPGTDVNVGSAVNLVISTGPPQVPVPNVVGDTEAAATSAITSAGLTLGTVTPQSSGNVPSGDVITETPNAGTEVNSGSAVNLVVSSGPAQVAVPGVVGITQAAATTAITSVGLVVGSVTTATSSTIPSGSVISENPVAGTLVNVGSAVNLVVSSGPAQVAVPNVVGITQAAATSAITGAGLVVGTVTTATSSTIPSGSVISESPLAGTLVNVGSAVNLVVSSGGARDTVPNVVGDTEAAAKTAITGAGLTVGAVTTQFSNTVPTGNVIGQNPSAGALLNPGRPVDLVVSVERDAVPNVVGDTQAAATTAITGAGLVVGTVSTQFSNTVPTGNVIGQNPPAGAFQNPGSPVNLVVSVERDAVPNVVGDTQAAATTAITGAGLVVGTVTTQSSSTIPSGSVISQNPPAGALLNPGLAVNLVVSSGPLAPTTIASAGGSVTYSPNPQTVTLTATVTAGTSTVNGGTLTFSFGNFGTSVSGIVASGTATATLSLPAGTTAGTYSGKVTYSGTVGLLTSSGGAFITVAQAVPVISWPAPASIIYGTPLSPTQLDATASVPGEFQYDPFSGMTLPAGTQTLTARFYPTDRTDYAITPAQTTLVVTKSDTVSTLILDEGGYGIIYGPVPIGIQVTPAGTELAGTVTIKASNGQSCTGPVYGFFIGYSQGGCSISFTNPGVVTVTGYYSGDNNHNPSVSAPASIIVESAGG